MPRLRITASLMAALTLLALPGGALAQSAGDDQYVDPLDGLTRDDPRSGKDRQGGGSPEDQVDSGIAGVGEAGAEAADLPGELARTGAELPLIAGAGLLLLAGGLALRRSEGERR